MLDTNNHTLPKKEKKEERNLTISNWEAKNMQGEAKHGS